MSKKFLYAVLLFIVLSAINTIAEDVLRPRDGVVAGSGSGRKYYESSSNSGAGKFSLGLEGGLNLNLFAQTFTWETSNLPVGTVLYRSTIVDVSKDGSGIGEHLALVGDYAFNRTSALHFRLGYENRTFGNDGGAKDINIAAQLVDVSADLQDNSSWISTAIAYRHSFSDNFFATLGINFDFLNGKISEVIKIKSLDANTPAAALSSVLSLQTLPGYSSTFPSVYEANITGDLSDSGSYSTRTAIELGLGYRFRITDKLSIVPQARFQYFLTPIWKDRNTTMYVIGTNIPYNFQATERRLHAMQFVIGLWYNF